MFIKFQALFILSFLIISKVMCQNNQSSGYVLTSAEKESAVNSISKLLFDNYIFPDVSVQMEKYIKSRLAGKEYDGFNEPQKFAEVLTKDLQSISKDKHIKVEFSPDRIKKMKENDLDEDIEMSPDFIHQLKNENYYFKKVERLNGNIGYIDIRNFGPGELIKDKVASVMGFVEDCNAIIFDMRFNGGGDPTGIQVITSYLFGEEPVHLNDLYFRPKDTTEEFWTFKDIKGKRMPDVPVYILTSSFTFSGAEEFTYNLKNLNRALVIGETTGGGAHPGGVNIADNNFLVFVPVGRAINPVTKTNWEGTGISPDIEINSTKALTKAHILALENIRNKETQENIVNSYNWLIESLNATLKDVNINTDVLKSFAGNYGERKIYYDNGKLYYQRNGKQKFELTQMSEDTFMMKDVDYFRIKFSMDDKGNVSELIGMYDDGRSDRSERKSD